MNGGEDKWHRQMKSEIIRKPRQAAALLGFLFCTNLTQPTGNLDSGTGHEVLGLLRVAAKRFSQTLILITHDMDIAQLADRIVCIEDGKIRKGSDENAEK